MNGGVVTAARRRRRVEGLSTVPRAEFREPAKAATDGFVERVAAAGVRGRARGRSGAVLRRVLLFAEDKEADLIVCGAPRGAGWLAGSWATCPWS